MSGLNKTAIKVSHVSKDFKLPHEKIDSVKSLFVNPLKAKSAARLEIQHALNDINFEVKKGEFFGIVGKNGSGKSTLLKIIAGIYQPTSGGVAVDGRLVPFIELGVGFNPELTGRENVYLNGALMGFSVDEVDVKYDEIVAFAELERFMDQKLKNYSSGMQVRLAFSVATVLADSDILLIDEVLAVGDADFQRKCFNYFRTLKRNSKTVVFVSHDMEAVREYCDRCVMIDSSQIVYEGSPEVAAEKYLKLFNSQNTSQRVQKRNEDRWGNGLARITHLTVTVDENTVTITAELIFKEELDDPIVGFGIKNTTGTLICGTNTKILRQKLGLCVAGSRRTVSWQIPNIFGDDTFTVETAITESDGVTQADWWHNAGSFIVHNDQSTPHVTSPRVRVKIT